jgi:hypothetical protein
MWQASGRRHESASSTDRAEKGTLVIISHRHRFVYIRTHKTASTSVEVFLAKLAGDDAIVTPIATPKVPSHRARNYERLDNPLRAAAFDLLHRTRPNAPTGPAYYHHISARGVRRRLGRRRWRSYFTFCFERNPWEKVISEYYWRQELDGISQPFREFVLSATLPSDFDLYSIDREHVGVDFVGRYERLEQDLRSVLDRLGISEPISLTHEKEHRPRSVAPAIRFDAAMHARVENVFAREIRAFDYHAPEHLAQVE